MSTEWIDILKNAVYAAYEKVRNLLGSEEGAESSGERGAGGDISTKIDLVAEQAVVDGLIEHNLNFHLVSEEVGNKYFGNEKNESKCKDYIVMDPIDGSLNANRGIPYSCISVAHALGPSSKDIFEAVILNVYTGQLYWTIKGKGAYRDDKKISVSKVDGIERAVMAVAITEDEPVSKTFSRYKPLIDEVHKIRIMGALALELAEVADGSFDIVMDIRKKLRIVDIAAGILLVKEAGGAVFSNKGEPLDVPLEVLSKSSIIATNKDLAGYVKASLPKLDHFQKYKI